MWVKRYTQLTRHEGNAELFDMVEMAILASIWGKTIHFHAEGMRGTGKTTIMRAAKGILPSIDRIKGCLYNCDPKNPHCPNHRHLSSEEIMALGAETVPMPFLEISHSAKLGTVVGSVDLSKITKTDNPEASILPGIIPQAHRGIIFIDEINRLADTAPEITDVLLDLMGTKPGRVQIEDTGMPRVEIPVSVSVWAASNPDEDPGPLQEVRRQLSDRFDFVLDMKRTKDVNEVIAMLEQAENWQKEKTTYLDTNLSVRKNKSQEIQEIAIAYADNQIPQYLRSFIASIYVKHQLESLRAIEAMQYGTFLNSALRKSNQILIGDLYKIIPLALRHRVDELTIQKILKGNNSEDSSSQSSSSSLLNPIKQFLSGTQSKDNNSDMLPGDPQGKARRLMNHKSGEMLKKESSIEG